MAPDGPNQDQPPEGEGAEVSLGEAITEVSDRATELVQEEIALAKAEVSEKVSALVRGGVAGLLAGFFVLLALILLLEAVAWELAAVFQHIWLGFAVTGAGLLVIAALVGLFAWRSMKKGSPPVPEMAIEEARQIKEQFAPADEEDAGSPQGSPQT